MKWKQTFRFMISVLIFLILIISTGCSLIISQTPIPTLTPGAATSTPEFKLPPQPEITPTETVVAQSLTPKPAPKNPRPQYKISVQFNYNRHFLAVEESILYTNQTSSDLKEFILEIEAARNPGGFRLLKMNANRQAISKFTLETNRLRFDLPQVLAPGQDLEIEVSFELTLPVIPAPSKEIRAAIYGYSERQVNLVDWYLTIPPYQAESGWLIHNPWYYGEHQVYEKADFTVDLYLIDPPANLQIAGASLPKVDGNHYSFLHKNSRNFTLSASTMYVVYAAVVGETTITSYAFPFDVVGGRTALQDAVKALDLYNRLFGSYPHESLAVVEADFHDGMEFDGLYFLSKGFYSTYDGTPKGYLTMIGVHETAHQWWYARVANDQAMEPWLDEALATYSELLYYNAVYPDLNKWWWSYRVDYFQPTGWINQRIYDYGGSDLYRNGVYLRGARFLDQVRQKVGDEKFLAFLKEYARIHQDQIVTANDFFSLLSSQTNIEIDNLKNIYLKP